MANEEVHVESIRSVCNQQLKRMRGCIVVVKHFLVHIFTFALRCLFQLIQLNILLWLLFQKHFRFLLIVSSLFGPLFEKMLPLSKEQTQKYSVRVAFKMNETQLRMDHSSVLLAIAASIALTDFPYPNFSRRTLDAVFLYLRILSKLALFQSAISYIASFLRFYPPSQRLLSDLITHHPKMEVLPHLNTDLCFFIVEKGAECRILLGSGVDPIKSILTTEKLLRFTSFDYNK